MVGERRREGKQGGAEGEREGRRDRVPTPHALWCRSERRREGKSRMAEEIAKRAFLFMKWKADAITPFYPFREPSRTSTDIFGLQHDRQRKVCELKTVPGCLERLKKWQANIVKLRSFVSWAVKCCLRLFSDYTLLQIACFVLLQHDTQKEGNKGQSQSQRSKPTHESRNVRELKTISSNYERLKKWQPNTITLGLLFVFWAVKC